MQKIFIVLFACVVAGCAAGAPVAPPAVVAAQSNEIVGRRIDIAVGSSSYEPAGVTAHVGELVTLVFTRTSPGECGAVVMFPALDIRRQLPVNEPVAIAFTPTQSGEIPFTCGMRMMKGVVIVE